MATMSAWQFQGASGPIEKTLVFSESNVQKPKVSDTELLVEVHSTTVNPIDFKILELGTLSKLIFRSPVTPGLDFCGRVVEVGGKVESFRAGDIVFGSCDGVFGHGALAEFVLVTENTVAIVPEGIKPEDLGTIATVGLTTYQAMKPYLKEGARAFINGGSGGTGVVAIQIAKALGCHVTTSCSSTNVELCKSLGADVVLDYKRSDIIEQLGKELMPFDLILDNVGTPANLYRAAHRFLAQSGTFIQVGLGMDLRAMRQLLGNFLLPRFLGGGTRKYVFAVTKPNQADLQQLAHWAEKGQLRAVVDSVHDFSETLNAFTRLKTGRAQGKVVVRVKTV